MLPSARQFPARVVSVAPTFAITAALAALPLLAVRRVADPSPWLHLKVGQFLLDGNRFGLPDPWAPFPSNAYVPTQWLPSVLSAVLFERYGPALLAWERAAGITLLALALVLWARSLTARVWLVTLVPTVVLYSMWPSLTERPQLGGFVLLVPVLAAWWRTAQDHRPRWWLIPLTWLAAATHGIWATAAGLGAAVTLALLVSRQVTRQEAIRLLALLASCGAAAALTPVGPRLLLTPFTVGSQGRQFVQEWLPASVRSPHVLAALALLAVSWLAWIAACRRPPGWQIVLWLSAIVLALSMQRTVAVAAILSLPLLCSGMEAALPPRRPPLGFADVNVRVLGGAVTVGLALTIPLAASAAKYPAGVPSSLEPQLRALPTGTHVLVDSDASGWLLFAVPALRPVYDLRVESYSPRQVEDYIALVDAEPGWQRLLASSGATAALVPDDAPLRAALTEELRWTETGRDGGLVLLEQAQ